MANAPLIPEVAERSRLLTSPSGQLMPPADYPGLFTCKIYERPAIGCVFRNGTVVVMPDHADRSGLFTIFSHMRALEKADYVTDIVWEWQVTRRIEDVSDLTE